MDKTLTKTVKKWGGSLVVIIDPDDASIHNIKEGNVLSLEIKDIKRK